MGPVASCQSAAGSALTAVKNTVRDVFPERLRAPSYRAFYAVRQTASVAYRGTGSFCPCCDGSFRHFRPWAGVPDCRCPRCGSVARQRLITLYLLHQTDLFTHDKRVLHLAPEFGLSYKLRNAPNVQHVTADLNLPIADIRLDATKMPFPDGAFDVILGVHILEHIPADRVAMRELQRILSPDGWAILQVPWDPDRADTLEDPDIATPADRLRHYGHEDHVRLYGRDYIGRLEESGFEVTEDGFVRQLSPALIRAARLDTTEDIVVCRKR
jgi:SAM-dependent methyltransferase